MHRAVSREREREREGRVWKVVQLLDPAVIITSASASASASAYDEHFPHVTRFARLPLHAAAASFCLMGQLWWHLKRKGSQLQKEIERERESS